MGLREELNRNRVASLQAASYPTGCRVCERKGVPVYPLRVAAVPRGQAGSTWRPEVPEQDVQLSGDEFKYALRTLRMGYLYVLLDKIVWHGYEVTADGGMRQFEALLMPEGDTVEPLAQMCRMTNHDVIAGFINIDNTCYSEAWLAFSRYPWSPDVLKGYQDGSRPDSRFTKIILSKEGQVSGDGCFALDESLSTLKANVAEFNSENFQNIEQVEGDDVGGVHGFYPRTNPEKQDALSYQIFRLSQEYHCTVMAVPLADEMGIIQELNNARMQLTESIQPYIERPEVLHQYVISQAITQYLEKIKSDITAQSGPLVESTGPSIGGYGPKAIPQEDVAAEAFARKYARLLKSYKEPVRADFDRQFDSKFTWPLQRLNDVDTDLAAWYQSVLWQNILTNDYAPETCIADWAAQMLSLSACLQGGAMGEATDKVWHQWLQTSDSPAWLGFTGMKTSLTALVFSGANVYGDLKAAATSDEFGRYLKSAAIKQGWASRLLAAAGSFSRLNKTLNEATRKSYLAMTQAAMLTAGESTVVLEYETTFRKLKRHLKNNETLRQSLSVNNATFKDTGYRGGGARVVDELMSMRGKALDTTIRVRYSAPGTLEQLRAELPYLNMGKTPFNNPAMVSEIHDLFISDLSLQGKGLAGPVVKASYAQLAVWHERGMRLISGDSAGLMLGAGLMALQVANWSDLLERLETSGGSDVDVVADISINNLLLIEGFTELSGFASKLALKQNWAVLSKAQQIPSLVRFGAVLGGVAAIVEGMRNWKHGWEVYKVGDAGSASFFSASAISIITSGVISGAYGFWGSFALTSSTGLLGIGPAGWATLLIIAGVTLAFIANELRTTAFEHWLRRSCFGIPASEFHGFVWRAWSLEDLAESVVEYRAIVSGMVADIAFASALDVVTGNTTIDAVAHRRLDFRVSLPGWQEERSGWSLTLTGGSQVLFAESSDVPGVENHRQSSSPQGYYKYAYRIEGADNKDEKVTKPKSLSVIVSIWVKEFSTPEATLVVAYWPDKSDPHYQLGLTVSAKRD